MPSLVGLTIFLCSASKSLGCRCLRVLGGVWWKGFTATIRIASMCVHHTPWIAHTRMVLSLPADSTNWPSEEKDTLLTCPVCPAN